MEIKYEDIFEGKDMEAIEKIAKIIIKIQGVIAEPTNTQQRQRNMLLKGLSNPGIRTHGKQTNKLCSFPPGHPTPLSLHPAHHIPTFA